MTLRYRGYTAKLSVDPDNDIIVGTVVDISDHIVFHATSVTGIKKEFAASVDDYLSFCEEEDISPAKPYSGVLSVRLGADLHRSVEVAASRNDVSMNEWIVRVIRTRIDAEERPAGSPERSMPESRLAQRHWTIRLDKSGGSSRSEEAIGKWATPGGWPSVLHEFPDLGVQA